MPVERGQGDSFVFCNRFQSITTQRMSRESTSKASQELKALTSKNSMKKMPFWRNLEEHGSAMEGYYPQELVLGYEV